VIFHELLPWGAEAGESHRVCLPPANVGNGVAHIEIVQNPTLLPDPSPESLEPYGTFTWRVREDYDQIPECWLEVQTDGTVRALCTIDGEVREGKLQHVGSG
jgi:hypothetical protein